MALRNRKTSRGTTISLKRAYAAPSREDGTRVLVDRIWPRGLRKESAGIDLWLKDLAPSTDLRRWFHQDAARWPAFRRRYRAELADKGEPLERLRHLASQGHVTLLFASADVEHNNAVVLLQVLQARTAGAEPAQRCLRGLRDYQILTAKK